MSMNVEIVIGKGTFEKLKPVTLLKKDSNAGIFL